MSSATFAQTRSQALNLEKQTEALLLHYSKFQTSTGVAESAEETKLVSDIQDIVARRDAVLGQINRISEAEGNLSTSKLQQLQRHKEILADHKLLFRKINLKIVDERNRNNLLFLVRSDINEHKQRHTSNNPNAGAASADDYILDERVRVDNVNNFAERLLNQAYQTRDELYNQRFYLQNAQLRMSGVLLSFPGINTVISKINTRRKRDTLILASVIALCIVMLIWLR